MKSVYGKYFATAALIWAACFVLFFFIYMLVLSPQKKNRKQIERRLDEKKKMYNSALKGAQEETKLKLNERIEQLRNRLEDFAIDFEDTANLTFDMSRIADEKELASFSIRSIDAHGSSSKSGSKQIRENYIGVSFTGGFNQFATFLNALERHRPVIFVDSFKITRSKQGGSAPRAAMSLAVFVRKRQMKSE